MISALRRPLSVSPTTPAYRGTPLRWLLISTIFYSGFFSSEAFDKLNQSGVSTDVADKHARYKRDCYLVRRSREGHELTQAIMAHIVASITVLVNAPLLYLPRRYAIANARIAPMPCSFAARMAANRSCFSGIFMSYLNKGICSI